MLKSLLFSPLCMQLVHEQVVHRVNVIVSIFQHRLHNHINSKSWQLLHVLHHDTVQDTGTRTAAEVIIRRGGANGPGTTATGARLVLREHPWMHRNLNERVPSLRLHEQHVSDEIFAH